ncbi:hypothetical protein EDD22DRAFT_1027991, partial [Suillus occidentalis]
AVLFCVPFVCASLPSLNDTCIQILDATNCPSCSTRTLWDIILSCGLTLFACTWTATHMNIPGMDEGVLSVGSRRLFIMVVALISPELIITWATRQFFSARNTAKDFNDGISTRAETYGNNRDISDRTAILLSDIGVNSSAPRLVKFPGRRSTRRFSGDDRYMSESIAASLNDTPLVGANAGTSAPRPAEFQERRPTRGFFGDDRDISEFTEANGSFESNAPSPAEIQEWRMTRGITGDNPHVAESIAATLLSDISEASGRSSAPRLVEFQGWTTTHGFFAWMGGFMLYVDGKPRATLNPFELLEFVRKGLVDMPVITEAEIEDRSKGDGLSKGIAILQLAWFVAQLIARYIQNLPITLLEIDTLAVAALTCISYGLWWKKPKDVGYPYIVHLKETATLPHQLAYENETLHIGGTPLHRQIRYFISYPFISLMGILVIISPRAARSRRVPSLGGYSRDMDRGSSTGLAGETVLLIGCFSGMVFGGIHCLGWNYFLQRHAELILWRATSLGIICAPVVISLNTLSYMRRERLGIFGFAPGLIASYIYIVARLTLFALMMLSLRSLPTGVYDTVAWTTFIPHL